MGTLDLLLVMVFLNWCKMLIYQLGLKLLAELPELGLTVSTLTIASTSR